MYESSGQLQSAVYKRNVEMEILLRGFWATMGNGNPYLIPRDVNFTVTWSVEIFTSPRCLPLGQLSVCTLSS